MTLLKPPETLGSRALPQVRAGLGSGLGPVWRRRGPEEASRAYGDRDALGSDGGLFRRICRMTLNGMVNIPARRKPLDAMVDVPAGRQGDAPDEPAMAGRWLTGT